MPPTAATPTLPAGLTVLIVDDDAVIAELWRAVLLRASPGVRTITASDGRAAVELARERVPDVVLMDLMMPGMDGFAATQELKSHPATARIPVVAVTGSMYSSQRVLDVGCDGYMIKPISPEALVHGIQRVLR